MTKVSDYLYRKASVHKIPLSGCFELSPICNFSCRMCYVRKTAVQLKNEGKQLINWEQWLALAEECRQAGMLYLLLTGGEPFLYPNFKELYLRLHEMGFILSINSNGYLIDDDTLHWLRDAAPSRINITLYGASPETYQKICGHSDGYERVIKNILNLKESGISIVINASMIPENASDMGKIFEFGKEHDIPVRMSTYMFPPVRRGREENDSRFSSEEASEMYFRKMKCQFTDEEYKKALQQQLQDLKQSVKTEEDWGHYEEYMKCRAGRCAFWVSWDGTMSACGMTPFPVQEMPFKNSFHECWAELTERVRNTPVLKACSCCPKRSVCNPCVAMLYAETGDVNEKAPYLCEMSEKIVKKMQIEGIRK